MASKSRTIVPVCLCQTMYQGRKEERIREEEVKADGEKRTKS